MLTTSLLSLAPDAPDAPLVEDDPSVDEVESVVDAASVPDVVSVLAVEDVVSTAEVSEAGGGGGGAMAASDEVPLGAEVALSAVALVSKELEEDPAGGGGGGGAAVAPVSPICSCSDRSADCMSLPSEAKVVPEETVVDAELAPWLSEDGGAKLAAADAPLEPDAPRRATRLLLVLVRVERDDICCLRGKLPLQH